MVIKIGDQIPGVTIKRLTRNGMTHTTTQKIFGQDRKIVMFGFPGAFTPTCTKYHFPDAIKRADEIRAKGVDDVIAVAVNDPFVLRHWEHVAGAEGKVKLYSDWDGVFTQAMNLGIDGSGLGLGYSSQRYAMIVTGGIVKYIQIEDSPALYRLTKSDILMHNL